MKKILFLFLPFFLVACSKDINFTRKVVPVNNTINVEVLGMIADKDSNRACALLDERIAFCSSLSEYLTDITGKTFRVKSFSSDYAYPSWEASNGKYKASEILQHHHINYKYRNTICLCYSPYDICTDVHGKKDYGIVGLGYCPGKVCIVSTYRIPKNQVCKAAAHEILHNLGLHHCPNDDPHCIMCDAKGKSPHFEMKEGLCETCKKSLKL